MEKALPRVEGIANLFKVLSKPDALKIFFLTKDGIMNSTHTIEDMAISQKRYYARLKALLDIGLVRKTDGVYGQTALGRLVYDRFLPAMGKAVDAKDELEFIMDLEGTELDNGAKKRILDELEIPSFAGSTKVRMIDDYESMVVDVIDLCDEAKESLLIATNHLDVRVLDANLRSIDRGVINNYIIGRETLSSKLKQLRMILSPKYTMAMMKLASSSTDMSELARIIDIPYSFCVADGYISIIEIPKAPNVSFITAFHIKNRELGKKLTDFFGTLWKAGELHSTIKLLNSFKT